MEFWNLTLSSIGLSKVFYLFIFMNMYKVRFWTDIVFSTYDSKIGSETGFCGSSKSGREWIVTSGSGQSLGKNYSYYGKRVLTES